MPRNYYGRRKAVAPKKAAEPAGSKHFTVNQAAIRSMISLLELCDGDYVYDLGAGKGALIRPLTRRNIRIVAVENDPALVRRLKRDFGGCDKVTVRNADLTVIAFPAKPFKAIANIPFHISSLLLEKLLADPACGLTRAALIVQYQAAVRFTQTAGARAEIIFMNALYDIRIVKKLKPTLFSPPPKVNCAILAISRRNANEAPDPRRLYGFLKRRLKNKRYPVDRIFKGSVPYRSLTAICQANGLTVKTPVASLDHRAWMELYRAGSVGLRAEGGTPAR